MTSQSTAPELTFSVPGVSCANCETAIVDEVSGIPAVRGVEVDLDAKRVTVRGAGLDEAAVRSAIEAAGYDVDG